MRVLFQAFVLLSTTSWQSEAFLGSSSSTAATTKPSFALGVSTSNIGLGPDEKQEKEEDYQWVEGVDYEVPDHESYRTSRRSKMDEECDEWFGKMLGTEQNVGILKDIAMEQRELLLTPVELKNDIMLPKDDEEWTPYVDTKLPWTPLVPAFGLEQYGLPVPRRNAETWRHFDVAGMVGIDYSDQVDGAGTPIELSEDKVEQYKATLVEKGGWLQDEDCTARLVYVNGRFSPQLSKTSEGYQNLERLDDISKDDQEEVRMYLSRLTDGFTDELAAPVPSGETEFLTSYCKLSGPDHNVGDPTSQFAINVQQGTACFAALNTIRTGAVAYIRQRGSATKPVILVNAVTADGGKSEGDKGVSCHPRALVVAEENSNLSFIQSCVDLDSSLEQESRPKLRNGYTQVFVKAGANLTHSYLEESGGMVTAGVEQNDSDIEKGAPVPREVEAKRPELQDTHLEVVDVHCVGDDASYIGTLIGVGGSGRVRVALSVSLLRPEASATVNGFMLSGGAQRGDMKTNIHHIGQGTISRQGQKNMVGGRATASFRGRIRVEQSAQQTDSEQLSRTILLSDRSRIWTVPSLEIIADDVQCTHGATVSDLSEEELFYLRSRGVDRALARNLLMYAFVGDMCAFVDPILKGSVDSSYGLQKRLIQRLENVVPQGDRAIKGEFQSV